MDRSSPENIHTPRAESVVSMSSSISASERRSVSFCGDNNSETGGAPSEIWEFQWEEDERELIVAEPKGRQACGGCCMGRGVEEYDEESDEDDDLVGTSIFGSLFRSSPIGKR